MTPFLIVLSVYRRVFTGVWLSAARFKMHPFHDEHIRVHQGLPAEMEADVVRHEINHGEIEITDVVPDSYFEWSAAPLGAGMLVVMLAGVAGLLSEIMLEKALQLTLFGGTSVLVYRIHTAKTMLEEAVNDDIEWEQYNLWGDYPEPVNTVIKIIDNWLHTFTGILDGLLLLWSSSPKIAANYLKTISSSEATVFCSSAETGDTQ